MDESYDENPKTNDEKRTSKSKTNSNNRFSERIGKDDGIENVYAD